MCTIKPIIMLHAPIPGIKNNKYNKSSTKRYEIIN